MGRPRYHRRPRPYYRKPRDYEHYQLYNQIMGWDPRKVDIMETLMQTILFMFEMVCALAQF